MLRNFLYFLLSLPIILLVFSFGFNYTVPLLLSNKTEIVINTTNNLCYPLQTFDFQKGSWAVYLVLSNEDKKNFQKIIPSMERNVLCTNDRKVLEDIKKVPFRKTGGDMATVTSYLCVEENNQVVATLPIAITEQYCGFQLRGYGWLEASSSNMKEHLQQFKPVYFPIVLLW